MSIICFGIIKLITLKNTEKLTQYKQTVATLSPHLVENNLDFFCQQTSRNGRMWTVLPSRQSLPKKGQKTVEILDKCGIFSICHHDKSTPSFCSSQTTGTHLEIWNFGFLALHFNDNRSPFVIFPEIITQILL